MQKDTYIINFCDFRPVNKRTISISKVVKGKEPQIIDLGNIDSDQDNEKKVEAINNALKCILEIKINNRDSLKDKDILRELCDKIQTKVNNSKDSIVDLDKASVEDDESNKKLFSTFNNELYTNGYVGVINYDTPDCSVTVNFRTRFDKNDDSPFLMYVFQKAFNKNGKIYDDMKISGKSEKTWDFLLMLMFLHYLKDALKKGIYRQYQDFEYNDSRIKGRIDIARHIKYNMPPNGKIAYETREFTANNSVNRLILKAVSCLEKRYGNVFSKMIARDDLVKKELQQIKNEIDDFDLGSEQHLIKMANKKIVQSVYKNYEPLRKVSIAILRRLGVNNFKTSSDKVSGVLISMPNLWEQFLYREIFCEFDTITNKCYKPENIFIIEERRSIQPDYYLKDRGIIIDAKYKNNWTEVWKKEQEKEQKNSKLWDDDVREDVFQVLAYMYTLGAWCGGVIFPFPESNKGDDIKEHIWSISEEKKEDKFCLIPYFIPEDVNDIKEFNDLMAKQSDAIKKEIKELEREN